MEYSEEKVRVPTRPGHLVAAEAAKELDASIAALEAWGARVPATSRLREAVSALRDAATDGSRAALVLTTDRGTRALQLGLDYSAIVRSLPPTRVADLRKDLEHSFEGSLVAVPWHGGPQRLQTQLVIRAAFHAVGLTPTRPRVLVSGGKRPDIFVQNGTIEHPVEVKRPQKWHNILPRFNDGAEQVLSAGGHGAVVIDITDCLRGLEPDGWNHDVISALAEISGTVLVPGVGYLPHRRHVIMAAVIARPTWVIQREGLDALAYIHSTSAATSYGVCRGTLDHHRGVWLRKGISNGLNRIGFANAES